MPLYRMLNPQTDKEEDVLCSIAEMEVLKEDGWKIIFTPSRIISGRDYSGQGGGHGTSDGWKDRLREIKSSHPGSTIDV